MATATRRKPVHVPLESGMHLSAQEFVERYEASDPSLKAELINGVVYVASPVSIDHGDPHADLAAWLGQYRALHPEVRVSDNATVRLDDDNVPQPDLHLRFVESRQHRRAGKYLEGAPELVCEIAASSASLDLYGKLEAYRTHGVQEYIVWRVYDDAIDWFWLNEGGYKRLEPDREGVIDSKVFPGLRLAAKAMLNGDLKTVLAQLQQS